MKKTLFVVTLCFVLAGTLAGQQGAADSPATKEDVEQFLEATHVREMFGQMVNQMAAPMHEMTKQQCAKNRDKMPPNCEAVMNKMLDDMMRSMPLDKMLDAMIPVYQKYLTKGDIEAMIAFYRSPVGEKMLRQMPQMTAEAMTAMMPIMQEYMQTVGKRLEQEMMANMKQEPAGAK